MQEFYIESINSDSEYNPDGDITVYIRHNGAAFCICYVAQELANSSSVLEQHRNSNRLLHKGDQIPETGERLIKPFEKLMTQLTLDLRTESTEYLHSYLYPQWFVLEATVDESSHVRPHFKKALSRQEFIPSGDYLGFLDPYLSPLLALELNTYSSRQVQVLTYTSRQVPSKVLVGDTVYFFKPWVSDRAHGYYELQSYTKMLAVVRASPTLLADAQICRLHGLVIDKDDDVLQHYHLDSNEEGFSGTRLVGLLLTYIENKGTLEDLAPWSDCTNEDRFRWSAQIRESVKCLHAAGVVWGDAKPDNVLVDNEDNACLIDFGGSFTPGWVDADKRETVEGDWQGVQRINEWLVKWSCHPVTRTKREKPAVQER
ncbi:hypothetical protein VE00_10562 [Pseudogymnoascus sp. WSF 3629]|nr:hypothetical protein VE00_10562 [Pseudogymnoascus sp. WSF 3629]